MATITSQLILSGSGITSESLSITNTSHLNVTNPAIESGTLNVTNTASALLPVISSRVYLYVKNTGTVSTGDTIHIETAAGINIIRLAPTDWCFLPVEPSLALKVQTLTSSGISSVEFSYFTAA
jgi:hypothetical protein|tara:strand:+ start:23 stop:394 length:372 start_codon:yes stop_codon:yes gene_type:complete